MKPAAPPPSRLALALLFPFQACDQQSLHGTSLKPTSGFFYPVDFSVVGLVAVGTLAQRQQRNVIPFVWPTMLPTSCRFCS